MKFAKIIIIILAITLATASLMRKTEKVDGTVAAGLACTAAKGCIAEHKCCGTLAVAPAKITGGFCIKAADCTKLGPVVA